MKRLNCYVFALLSFILSTLSIPIYSDAATVVGGAISVNTTWTAANGPYYVTSSVDVNPGVTLTIEPGTIVKFGSNLYMQIYGTLNAAGTAGAGQIYFTSYRDDSVGGDTNGDGPSSGSPGDWIAFFVYGGGSISLDHSVVRYAGANNSGHHAVWKMNDPGNLSVTNSVISDNLGAGIEIDSNSQSNVITGNTISSNSGDGLYLNNSTGTITVSGNQFTGNDNGLHSFGSSPTISGNTFSGNNYGLYIQGTTIPGSVTNNTFSSNTTGPIALDANGSSTVIDATNNLNGKALHIVGGAVTVNRTWASPHPYYLTSSVDVNSGSTLTIEPGTIVKFGSNLYMQIYGTLNAAGTAGAGQIYFTSYRDDSVGGDTNGDGASSGAPGDWIAFFVYGGGSISLDHSVVRYAGANNSGHHAVWKMNDPGNLSVTNSVISDNVGVGIAIDSNSQGNTITGNTITSNSGDGVYLYNTTGTITVSGNQFTGNDNGLHSFGSSPAISGNTFSGNNYGLYVQGTTIPGSVTNNTFSSNTTGPIALDANGSGTFIDGLNNLNGRGLHIVGGTMTVNRTWASPHPYYVTGWITIDTPVTHTIQLGTIVKFGNGQVVQVYGALNAPGTDGAGRIYFTSYRDDSVGGDTNGDGPSSGSPGDWIAFFVYGGGSISLDHSVVRYAGANNSGHHAVWKMNDPGNLSVTNSVISDNVGVGIAIDSNSQGNTITGNTITSNSGDGVYLSSATGTVNIFRNIITANDTGILCSNSSPTIGGSPLNANDIYGNTTYSVQNVTSSIMVNATYNWWGSSSGPGLSGPNAVSSYVDYSNFLAAASSSQPAVLSTNPAANAVEISPNSAITITWSKYIDCSTVNTAIITINSGAALGTPTCTGNTTTATFPVGGQTNNVAYTVTVGSGVRDIYGKNMASAYVFSYTTVPVYKQLTITKTGSGGGTVTSSPSGINCGSTCSAQFAMNDAIDVSASADSDSGFIGFSGDCNTNTSPCHITIDTDKSITARFDLKSDFEGNPLSGQAPHAVQFTDRSIAGATSWQWNFGDGQTSALQNPVHMYKNAGSYNVSLTSNGSQTTKADYVVVTGGCTYGPVMMGGTSYGTIPDALSIASPGDVIKVHAADTGQLNSTQGNPVTIQGGYDCGFNTNPDYTSIQGSMTISGGSVTVENLSVK